MTRAADGKNRWSTGETDARQEAALRLFGALSGVKEDYLAACEADAGTAGKAVSGRGGAYGGAAGSERAGARTASGMTRFIHRYGRAMAAVVCAAVLGVSYLSFRIGVFTDNFGGSSAQKAKDSGMCVNLESAYDTAALETEKADEEHERTAGAAAESPAEDFAEESGGRKDGFGDEIRAEQEASGGMQGSSQTGNEMSKNGMEKQQEITDGGGCLKNEFREMKMDEAKSLQVVGAYFPTVWPADGKVESICGDDAEGQESFTLTWSCGNGWDSFFLTVRNLGSDLPEWVQEAAADVTRPEMYDKRLYEIPYADSLPGEYWSVFNSPIFREEDFTKECVEARILANTGDRGDTDTPRGNFSVLYRTEEGGYVLADFNGRGSVEEIWRLMCSLKIKD